LRQASQSDALMEGMIEMSQINPDYRARLILYLRGDAFNREIENELRLDASLERFSMSDRTAIVQRWIRFGDLDAVQAYLEEFADALDSPWLLYASPRNSQGRLEEAVEIIRAALPVPAIPEVTVDRSRIDRLKRGFFAGSSDFSKGTALMAYYLEGGEYREALRVLDVSLQQSNPPGYMYYWRAEILYQLEDYSESWYAFEAYLKQLK
jgi:hypothetical protein